MSRWAAPAGAAVVVGLGWALVAPAGAAQAVAPPVAPVTMPSSILGALAGPATTAEAVGSLTATGGGAIAGTTALSAVPVATVAGYAGAGLLIGFAGASAVVQVAGLSATGDFGCDLAWVFDEGAACATTAAPQYVPNSDVVLAPPGWVGGVNTYTGVAYVIPGWTNKGPTTVAVAVSGPPVGTAGSVQWQLSATLPTGANYVELVFRVVRDTDGGLISSGGGVVQIVGGVSAVESVAVQTVPWHLEIGATDQTPFASWYPVGHELRPEEPEADPLRWWKTTWRCTDGSLSSASSTTFRESEPEWPGMPTAQCDGSAVSYIRVEGLGEGVGSRTIFEWEAPAAFTDWAATADPQCVGGGCQLLLSRIDEVTGAALSCFANPTLCADWWAETEGATVNVEAYRCEYGGQTVPLNECQVYAPTFDTGQYADPRTGETVVPAPGAEPVPADESCPPPFSWSALFNQWWAFKATGCALQEAFVPQHPLNTGAVQTAVDASVLGRFGEWGEQVSTGFQGLTGGCGVIFETTPTAFAGNSFNVDTCGFPWSSMGSVRTVIGYGFILGAVVMGVRTITRIIRVDTPDTNGAPS